MEYKILGLINLLAIGILLNFKALAINQQSTVKSNHLALEQCLNLSLKAKNSLDRDRSRMNCVYKHISVINSSQCSKIARTLEYSNFEDELKLFCMSDLSSKTNFHQCFQVASSMNYIDNSENAKWNCIKRFEKKINHSDCLSAARQMKFSYNRDKILSYCNDELKFKK